VGNEMGGLWTHRGFEGWAEALQGFPSCSIVRSRGGERPNHTINILVMVLLGGCNSGMLQRSGGCGVGVGGLIMTTEFAAGPL